jgi:hypothetical protein
MKEVKYFPIYLKENLNLDSFSALILNNLEVGITYNLCVEFIYCKPVLDSIFLDKYIVFKILESNSKKSTNRLYHFLLNKVNTYNKIKLKTLNNKYKDIQAEVLLITYIAIT